MLQSMARMCRNSFLGVKGLDSLSHLLVPLVYTYIMLSH
jgi:hypothetical protein